MPHNYAIKAATYKDILAEKLPLFIPLLNCEILQQDSAPVCTTKCIKGWIHQQGYSVLDGWHSSSQDLNPIENCWVMLKQKMTKLNPISYDDLVQKMKLVWIQEITTDY